jgi:hypothetical protein
VRSGLHRGARIKLCNRSYSVGSAIEADIVLRDRGIGSRHALLHLEGQRVKIEAYDGNVGVGSRVLAEGYACYLQLPAELALGNVHLRLVAAPRPAAVGIIARIGSPTMKSMNILSGGALAFVKRVGIRLHGFIPRDLDRVVFAATGLVAAALLRSASFKSMGIPCFRSRSANASSASSCSVPIRSRPS